MNLFSVSFIKERPIRLGEAALRLGLATLIAWGLLLWAVTAHFQAAGWDRLHGWTGSPGPVLTKEVYLGQPLLPEKGAEPPAPDRVLGHVSPRFATFSGRATGSVELVLLKGKARPRSLEEIEQRRLHSRIIPAERLSDNDLGRFNVPGARLNSQGLFLLVRRPISGQARPGPLTLWLDNDRNWPGGRAFVLTAGPGGTVEARPGAGHLSLGWGYDRPGVRVFLAQKPWYPWAFGAFWVALGLLSLVLLPRARDWLKRRWDSLSVPDEPLAGPDRSRWPWLPWAVMAAGAIFTLYLQGMVKEGVFYSGDAGIKLLMIKQFLSGNSVGWLDLPAQPWVSELWAKGLYPFEPPFVHLHQDRHFVAFPQVFPLLNTPLFALFGFRGLYLIPLAAGWLLWLRFFQVGRRAGLDDLSLSLGLAGLILASPLTLYTAMFWGHTLAVLTAFTGLTLAFFPKRRPLGAGPAFWAGLITGLGVWFRAETVCLGGATALALFALAEPGRKLKPAALYTLGFGAGVILLWLAVSPLFGRFALGYGHPLGHHAVISGTGLDLSTLTGLLAKGWEAFNRLHHNLYAYFPLAGAVALITLGLALFRGPGLGRALRGLIIIYALFILTASPILEPPGKQWGPRYMFLTLPLICLAGSLAWQRIEAANFWPVRLGAALVLALALAVGGGLNLKDGPASLKRDYAERVLPSLEFIQSRADKVVAVSDQHIAQELAHAFTGRTWFHAREPAELTLLARGLKSQAIPECLFLYNHGERPPENFIFESQGGRSKASFEPLGRKGRYQVTVLRISP